jgi:hypothetical protein
MKKAFTLLLLSALWLNGCSGEHDFGQGPGFDLSRSSEMSASDVPIPDHVFQLQKQEAALTVRTEPPIHPSKPPSVKGIYISAWKASGSSLDSLMKLLDETDLNAVVIDAKTDTGQVTYDSQVPTVNEIDADETRPISNMKGLVQRFKQKNIYAIARVVVFKDPYLASVRNDLAMHTKTGAVWRDKKGVPWVDPYNEKVQDYAIAIAKEAADLGFDEIQFDYVRFPDNGKMVDQEVLFQNGQHKSKAETIRDFVKKAKERITNAHVSADVFGLTTSSMDDMGIGQDWMMLSQEVDVLSPMIYPSHYRDGSLGVQNPDLHSYEIVKLALQDALKKNAQLQKAAQIRPWLQDFTATWVHPHQIYGTAQVKEQVRAAKVLGIDQFLLWNPSCTYSYRD